MTEPENQQSKPESAIPIPAPRTIRLDDLLRGQRDVLIAHGPEVYRLRLTRNGKLILTK